MRNFFILIFFLFSILISGCATTRIISEEPEAEILMDGELLGRGTAEVNSIGPPNTAILETKLNGKKIGYTTMSRSISWMTLVWGACSYYTGLYWGWYYPESVMIYSNREDVLNKSTAA